jgi:UDPglucose--hexose-1-phosphate uridylyltransferase
VAASYSFCTYRPPPEAVYGGAEDRKHVGSMSTLRWNSMIGEWTIVAPARDKRPFQNQEQKCPFCDCQTDGEKAWRALTVDNKYAALSPDSGEVPLNEAIVMEAPAFGYSKVILLSPNHDEQMEDMQDAQVQAVMEEYIRSFEELDGRRGVHYVLQFENRGRAAGVSLDHPHAQVYALPFIPPRIRQELSEVQKRWESEGLCLVCETIENELKISERIIHQSEHFVSLVPFAPRAAYEVHVYPIEHASSLLDLRKRATELGLMIKDVARRYSKVFEETTYAMAFHTRPSKGNHPYWHFHIEFYPPWSGPKEAKHLGGIELGAGLFTNGTSPESVAEELRSAL